MYHSTTGIAKYRSVLGNDYRVHAYAVSLAVTCVWEPLPYSLYATLHPSRWQWLQDTLQRNIQDARILLLAFGDSAARRCWRRGLNEGFKCLRASTRRQPLVLGAQQVLLYVILAEWRQIGTTRTQFLLGGALGLPPSSQTSGDLYTILITLCMAGRKLQLRNNCIIGWLVGFETRAKRGVPSSKMYHRAPWLSLWYDHPW